MDFIVSLTPEVTSDPLAAVAAPPPGATLIEVRLDRFPGLDVGALVAASRLPVLATLRSAAEGGAGPDDAALRGRLLAAAHEAGASLLDFEFARDLPLIAALGVEPERRVLSWHDPLGTPADLAARAAAISEIPAALCKVIPTAGRLADVEQVLRLYPLVGRRRVRLIAFAMGEAGLPSRFLAPLLGAPVAFAAWEDGAPAAPGQVSVSRLEPVIGHLRGRPRQLYGVVGRNVAGSLSPPLHVAGYRAEGLPFAFVPVNITDADELSLLFTRQGDTVFDRVGLAAAGWAVTAPFKLAAAESADLAAPRVRRSRAANTLILKPHQVIAENTDADGVVGSLTSRGVGLPGVVAVVQGTGGAARGAAVGLDLAGATVLLRGRDDDRTRRVADEIGVGWCAPDESPGSPAVLVNATPLGLDADDEPPFDEREVAGATAVVDMVYGARPTRLAELAAAAGVELIDGREMLLHQGYAQFAAFTGRLPPRDAMRSAVLGAG